MGPIDYTSALRVANPADVFQQSFTGFNAIRQADLQQQAQERQLAQAQQMRADLAALSANPTPQAIAQMSVKYPQLSEQFKRSHDMLTTEQQQSRLNAAIPVFAAVQNGRNDIAIQTLRDRAKALTGSGQEGEAKQIEAMASLIEQSPQTAKLTMGTLLSSIMGPDKFATTFQTLGQEARASDKAPGDLRKVNADAAEAEASAKTAAVTAEFARQNATADLDQKAAQLGLTKAEVKNVNSQIGTRAAQLKIDRDKLQLETDRFIFEKTQKANDIGQDGRKIVNESAVTAGAAKLAAERANDLANRIEGIGSSWGALGSASEWLARQTGRQDAVTELRQEYTRLRNSGLKEYLPPGPSTDKDVALALEGFPPATANPTTLKSFLRGMAKLNDISAAVENARADYAANNKGLLGKARDEFQAGGVNVASGDSWVKVSKQVAEAAARKYTPAQDRVQAPTGAALIPGSGTPEARAQDAQRAGQSPGREVSFNDLRNN